MRSLGAPWSQSLLPCPVLEALGVPLGLGLGERSAPSNPLPHKCPHLLQEALEEHPVVVTDGEELRVVQLPPGHLPQPLVQAVKVGGLRPGYLLASCFYLH